MESIYSLPNRIEHEDVSCAQVIQAGFCVVNNAFINTEANKAEANISMVHFVARLMRMEPTTCYVSDDVIAVNERQYLELEGLSCLQWT